MLGFDKSDFNSIFSIYVVSLIMLWDLIPHNLIPIWFFLKSLKDPYNSSHSYIKSNLTAFTIDNLLTYYKIVFSYFTKGEYDAKDTYPQAPLSDMQTLVSAESSIERKADDLWPT